MNKFAVNKFAVGKLASTVHCPVHLHTRPTPSVYTAFCLLKEISEASFPTANLFTANFPDTKLSNYGNISMPMCLYYAVLFGSRSADIKSFGI